MPIYLEMLTYHRIPTYLRILIGQNADFSEVRLISKFYIKMSNFSQNVDLSQISDLSKNSNLSQNVEFSEFQVISKC